MAEATESRQLLSDCGWSDDAIPSAFTMLNSISWVAVEDGEGDELVGFMRVLSDYDVVTYVAEIAIASRVRGHGVGKALIHQCHAMTKRVDVLSSASAEAFYDALGYSERPAFRWYR